jgi:hypothetical protein
MKIEEQKETSARSCFIFVLFSGNWFSLGILIFCILSLPYILVGCVWFLCLQLHIFKSGTLEEWEEWNKYYIYYPIISIAYIFIFWPLALCLSPICLLVGLFDPCLVIPEDYPQKRWFVTLSYLTTPITIISMVLITELLSIL